MALPRLCPDYVFPAERFIPGRGQVHPRRAGTLLEVPTDDALAFGLDLLGAHYFWEAHEVWEGLWTAWNRTGPRADAVRGLIRIAAAGVKCVQGEGRGIESHLGGATALLENASQNQVSLDLVDVIATKEALRGRPAALDEESIAALVVRKR